MTERTEGDLGSVNHKNNFNKVIFFLLIVFKRASTLYAADQLFRATRTLFYWCLNYLLKTLLIHN